MVLWIFVLSFQIKSLYEVQQQYDLLYTNYDKLQHEYSTLLDTLHDTEARLDGATNAYESSEAKLTDLKCTHENMCQDKDKIFVQYQETYNKLEQTENTLNQAHDEHMDMDVSMKELQFSLQQLTEEKRKLQVGLINLEV